MPSSQDEAPSVMHYASFWRRAGAIAIDGTLYMFGCQIAALGLFLIIPSLPRDGVWAANLTEPKVAGFVSILWLLVIPSLVFYLPSLIWKGQTIGKKIFGIRIVSELGNSLTWGQIIVRPWLYIPSMVGLLGFLWSIWDKEKRCWHDFLARTRVVRAR